MQMATGDFGEALRWLRSGAKVQRAGWNGRGMWLALQAGCTVCKFLPYIMMRTAGGEFVPWLASQTDVLSFDWSVTP